MYILSNASRIRQREAQLARENRAEIVRALNQGEVTRRELLKWGIFTASGYLACKNGLSPFAKSAYAAVPTGTPRTPLFGIQKFSQPMHRLNHLKPLPITRTAEGHAAFPAGLGERPAKRLSYHTDFSADPSNREFINPVTYRGPIEGRPPGEVFAHQRWDEFFPKVGYIMRLGQVAQGSGGYFHDNFPLQHPDSCWTYGGGRSGNCTLPPFLIKGRYGEPIITRIYNDLPTDRKANNGFGRNETQLHFHNAHNGAESDGAANVHHFPGTFYDYRWSTALARRDKINTQAGDPRASGPDDNIGLVNVAGDFRELQGTMWAHDHRFFFTAENVYKGNLGAINYYSGPDRGNEELNDGVNLRLPSGKLLGWGNTDFDVNLIFSDCACDAGGQLYFDIFDTDGMLGDVPLVNFGFAPFFEVLPRKYRFRVLNACMSRFLKLGLADARGNPVPITFIANDGNLVVNPIRMPGLPVQGMGERFDFVVDFSGFKIGDRIRVVNHVRHEDGRRLKEELSLSKALKGTSEDPVVGPMLEFRIVGAVESVDVPGVILRATDPDKSQVPATLTEQIPIVTPVRTRMVEFGKSGTGDSRGPNGCTPDCGEYVSFPWTIRINGESSHSMNANRISLLVPKAGEVEHWTYKNGGGGWDHPIHLHFEEGVTMLRNGQTPPPTENLQRKDVWRLGESGSVTFQIQFGEFGGSYVNHCHNTVHEDFAMLARIQLLTGVPGSPQSAVTPTPNPTPDGVFFTTPEILPEGAPRGWKNTQTQVEAQLETAPKP
ncbi:multicopper oxidase domain-containing protein [Rhizobium sp. BK399]|uniref:multicopper oxidase family protein n=1 Tax=Rhizobium sp. BK399 TaxID=2587063 RepID=UPI001612527E|nr:multicopper oxidase domain-containing protein [Rhizobium sp. BK399]MBB3543200.1 FtsP/CotA-like multicopper oxidase with cupredoxin domain [Rhizobium sp. BK399]